jgi:hypothetical protein
MSKPTPEERAYELGLATYTGLADEAKIADAIRAAVAVEREALEKIAVDDPRGPGEGDCIEIARAALHAEDPSARAGSADPK